MSKKLSSCGPYGRTKFRGSDVSPGKTEVKQSKSVKLYLKPLKTQQIQVLFFPHELQRDTL